MCKKSFWVKSLLVEKYLCMEKYVLGEESLGEKYVQGEYLGEDVCG